MIGVLAGVENVFPPVPADTAVALGAFLSNAGTVSATAVFLITWTANVTTATSVYLAGRSLGRSFFTGRLGRRLLDPARLDRLERLYHDHGAWGIFLSRFIPGVRAVVPPFAGVAGLGAWRAIVPMAVASGIWYGLLTFLAATAARSLDDLALLVAQLNWAVGAIALSAVVAVVAGIILRRRHRTSPSPDREKGQE